MSLDVSIQIVSALTVISALQIILEFIMKSTTIRMFMLSAVLMLVCDVWSLDVTM